MADEDARKFSGFCSEGQLRISSLLSRLLSLLARAAPPPCQGSPRGRTQCKQPLLLHWETKGSTYWNCSQARLSSSSPCPSSVGLGQAGRGYWMLLLEQAGLCSLASLPSCASLQVRILHISPLFFSLFQELPYCSPLVAARSCLSKCGLQTSSITTGVTWELTGNAGPTLTLLSQGCRSLVFTLNLRSTL